MSYEIMYDIYPVYFIIFIWIQPGMEDTIRLFWCMLCGKLTLSDTVILLGTWVNPGIHSHEILHYYSNVNRGLLVRPPWNNSSLILQERDGWILYKPNSSLLAHQLPPVTCFTSFLIHFHRFTPSTLCVSCHFLFPGLSNPFFGVRYSARLVYCYFA